MRDAMHEPVAFDTETWPIRPGLLAPRMVCGSFFRPGVRSLALRADALQVLRNILEGDSPIVGLNIAYDFGVVCATDPSFLPLVFDKYDRGQVHDVAIREALIDIARGCLYRDPETNAPIGRYSMLVLARRHLGLDLSEDKKNPDAWRLRYNELDGVPLARWPQAARDYAENDAEITYKIFALQEGGENLHDEPRQVRAAWALHLASTWGIRTDGARVSSFCERVERLHAEARKKFLAAGLVKVRTCIKKEGELEEADPITAADLDTAPQGAEWLPAVRKALAAGKPLRYATDTAAVRARVVEAYRGSPPYSEPSGKFPEGQVKADRDTLAQSGDTLLDEFGGSSNVEKLRSTYAPILKRGVELPINTRFNTLMASGRISSEDPNLTNQPRSGGVRECFVARPGFVLSSSDYKAGELCTLAEVLHWLNDGPTAMGDAIRAGKDLHIELGAQILGITYEEFEARRKAKDKEVSGARQLAKPGNFGLPGGLGVAKLVMFARGSYGNLCELSGRVAEGQCGAEKVTEYRDRQIAPTCTACLEVGEQLKEAWFAAWPEMQGFFDWVAQETEGGGRITQLGSDRVRGDVGFCDGANTMFQGLLADGAKDAFYAIAKECYVPCFTEPGGRILLDGGARWWESPLYGSRPLILVHDETIAEHPVHKAVEASARAAELMREHLQKLTPHVPIECEPVLMWRWLKGAEAWKGADGKILPLVAEQCPSCDAIAPTNLAREVQPHDEIRDGKKTGQKCAQSASRAA